LLTSTLELLRNPVCRPTLLRLDFLDTSRLSRVNSEIVGDPRNGETAQSRNVLETLQKSEPTNTYLKVYWFPVIEATIAMAQQAPDQAIVRLEPSLPYELGSPPPVTTMHPPCIRGMAYLAEKNGPAAAAEFQKFVDHPGIVLNFLLGSLTRL
jgi:eukaryotic-like serine/threonine-protein kinase